MLQEDFQRSLSILIFQTCNILFIIESPLLNYYNLARFQSSAALGSNRILVFRTVDLRFEHSPGFFLYWLLLVGNLVLNYAKCYVYQK